MKLARFPATFRPNPGRQLAIFQYTSGTTRELPEAVKHTHRAIVTLMVAALYGTGLRPGRRFMCSSSPAWDTGVAWHPGAAGARHHHRRLCGKFNPEPLLQALLRITASPTCRRRRRTTA